MIVLKNIVLFLYSLIQIIRLENNLKILNAFHNAVLLAPNSE